MKLLSLLLFMKILALKKHYHDHPYFKKDDYNYHKFEKGHIYSQANGHATGDEGQSNVYSSKNKSQASAHGTDYSNARTKYNSFNDSREYGFDRHGWNNYQSEFQRKAQQQVENNSNAEAYGNASSHAVAQKDNAESMAHGDDFSATGAKFNMDNHNSQHSIAQKNNYWNKKRLHKKEDSQDKTETNSQGKSYGQGYSSSKGSKNGSEQHNKGGEGTESDATYKNTNHKRHHKILEHFDNKRWGNHHWDNHNDSYWDNYY